MLGYHALNYLSENVYTIYEGYDEEDINYEITTFFNKLMKRRRNDDIEEGLQAGGVILPDRAGFKISERDGYASHAQAQENVSQYLNGETSFTGEETVGFTTGARGKDPNTWMNIPKNGFTVRIVATKESMIFIFSTYKYKATDFQLNVIYKLIDCIKASYQNEDIKYPFINYVSGSKRFIFNENKDVEKQLDQLEDFILNEKSITKEKTR